MLAQERIVGLHKGTQLFCQTNSDPQKPRILMSSGTTQEIKPVEERLKYRSNTFVPQEPWRELSLAELKILGLNEPILNKSQWQLGSSMGICRFPDEVLAPLIDILERLELRAKTSLQSRKQLHQLLQNQIAQVINYLPRYYLYPQQIETIGVSVQKGGLRTTTNDVNKSSNSPKRVYIGMHLDSHDLHPLRRRHKSRNRICINLGREERFFLFINLPLMNMFHALGLSDKEDIFRHYRGLNLGYEFMKRYPSYPVMKLRVEPGEAYIAPTDNIIHDGSSVGKKYPDLTLTFLGYFGIRALT